MEYGPFEVIFLSVVIVISLVLSCSKLFEMIYLVMPQRLFWAVTAMLLTSSSMSL